MSVVILLAGMQSIDPTLYDAARVDGAGYGRMFLDITIPSLRNTITIVILLALVDAFKVFDIIWATTQGGPIRATEVLSTYLFKEGSSRTSTAMARPSRWRWRSSSWSAPSSTSPFGSAAMTDSCLDPQRPLVSAGRVAGGWSTSP